MDTNQCLPKRRLYALLLLIPDKRGMQSLRVLDVDTLDVAVEFLFRAFLIVTFP